MPPLPPANGIIRTHIGGILGTTTSWGIRLFWKATGAYPYATGDLDTFADNVIGQWHTNLVSAMSSDTNVSTVTALDLSTGGGLEGVSSLGPFVGTLAGPVVAANSARVMDFNVPLRYRGGHPHCFLPPLSSAYLSNPTTWSNGEDLQTKFAAFISGVHGATLPAGIGTVNHVSVSYYTGHALRPTPIATTVASYSYRRKVGSQRRRVV